MCSETLDFAHSGASGNPEWLEVAGPEHENVLVREQSNSNGQHFFIGAAAPASSADGVVWAAIPVTGSSNVFLRVRDARESVWVRIDPNRTLTVVRGSAVVNF